MFELTQEQFINTIRTLKHGGGSIPWQHPVGVFHQRKVHRGWLVLRGQLMEQRLRTWSLSLSTSGFQQDKNPKWRQHRSVFPEPESWLEPNQRSLEGPRNGCPTTVPIQPETDAGCRKKKKKSEYLTPGVQCLRHHTTRRCKNLVL